MFNHPVVIVVGAGASFDTYGLPLGTTLAAKIAEDTDFVFEHYSHRPTKGDADFFERNIWAKFNSNRDKLNLYTQAGQRLAAAISSTVSIDDALHQLSEFPEAIEIGKMCIIRSILKAEGKSELRNQAERQRPAADAGRNGWIEQIFSMAITGFKLSEIELAFRNLTFVNFNYDRCIEQYLYWSLQRVGLSPAKSAEIVRNLNIIRPYGGLGSILSGEPSHLPFGGGHSAELFTMVGRIRTFTESEALHDAVELSKALSTASMVIFLGFGFHPQNLRLLALDKPHLVREVKVLATTFDVHDAVIPELRAAIAKCLRVAADRVETHPMKASEILKRLRIKIEMAVG